MWLVKRVNIYERKRGAVDLTWEAKTLCTSKTQNSPQAGLIALGYYPVEANKNAVTEPLQTP